MTTDDIGGAEPGGIASKVVLALAGKAQQVFAAEGTYLSFPLSPVGFTNVRFQALASDSLSAEGQAALAEFSLLVNEIPEGAVWQPDADQRLWDVYGDVLDEAELPDERRTDAEDAEIQAAHGVLYVTAADGHIVDSSAVVAFTQYRDAYFAAIQEYNNRKGQAEGSDDNSVQEQWQADEPHLLEAVASAERAWEVTGRKSEIDRARDIVDRLSSKSPHLVWSEFRKLFDPDTPEIFFRKTPEGSAYLPTTYAPTNIVELDWNTITVTASELDALSARAPQTLQERLGESSEQHVKTVRFEYAAVKVQRPWFNPVVFGSRAWRFPEADRNRILSDGGDPPTGECSAYISALVLGRKIEVHQAAATGTPIDLGFIPMRILGEANFVRPYKAATLTARTTARRAVATPRSARAVLDLVTARATVRDHRSPSEPRVRDHRTHRVNDVGDRRSRPAVTVTVRVPAVRGRVLPPPEPAPVPPGLQVTTTGGDEVYILAFVCRMLPKSPDPDPYLSW